MRIRASWARRGLVIVAVLGALNLLVIPIAWSRPGTPPVAAQVTTVPEVTVAPTVATVVEDGAVNGQFTFTRTGATDAALTVSFTVGGTATSATDFVGLGTTIGFAIGQSSVTLAVDPIADTAFEDDETVIVTVTDGTEYDLGTPSSATVTIQDDDVPVVTLTASDDEASEPGTNKGQFTVTRSGVTTDPLTVSYTMSGSAVNGTDYSYLGGSVLIPAGQVGVSIDVSPIDDTNAETTEEAILTITDAAAYDVQAPGSATVKIFDNDAVVVTVDDTDGSAGEGTVPNTGTFTFTRTGPTTAGLSVNYTLSGSAVAADYTPVLSGSVAFAAGSSTATIVISPIDDVVDEPTETLVLTLASGTGYAVGSPSSATITIADNDDVVITVLASDASAGEGTTPNPGEFTITRTGPTSAGLTVYFTLGGTASAADYSASLTSPVTIPAGMSTVKITITPVNDALAEPTENVVLTLTSGAGYTVGTPGSALVSITDDDGYVSEKREDAKDVCKNGGWKDFGVFKNQGDCVSYIATGGKNPPALGPAPTELKSLVPMADDSGHPGKGKAKGKKK